MRAVLTNRKGFSLIEALVVVAVLSILSSSAIPALAQYIKTYRFDSYASQMEYLIKYAKIYGMERTTNVGICVDSANKVMTVRDLGPGRGSGICSGIAVRSMGITEDYIAISGSGAAFDPRGVAIWTGSACVAYNNRYSRVCMGLASVRTENGSGGCTSCTN